VKTSAVMTMMTMITEVGDVTLFLLDRSTSSSVTVATNSASTAVKCNSTQNASESAEGPCHAAVRLSDVESRLSDIVAALIGVLLSAVIIGTLLGNASVILAVTVYDKMRTLSNVLIASLGSADLLVAIVVMPISLQVRLLSVA